MTLPMEVILIMWFIQLILTIIVSAIIFYRLKKNCEEITLKNCNGIILKYMIFASVILNLVLGGEIRNLVMYIIKFVMFFIAGWLSFIIGFKLFKISSKKEELTHKKIWLYSIVIGFIASVIFPLSVWGIIYLLQI